MSGLVSGGLSFLVFGGFWSRLVLTGLSYCPQLEDWGCLGVVGRVGFCGLRVSTEGFGLLVFDCNCGLLGCFLDGWLAGFLVWLVGLLPGFPIFILGGWFLGFIVGLVGGFPGFPVFTINSAMVGWVFTGLFLIFAVLGGCLSIFTRNFDIDGVVLTCFVLVFVVGFAGFTCFFFTGFGGGAFSCFFLVFGGGGGGFSSSMVGFCILNGVVVVFVVKSVLVFATVFSGRLVWWVFIPPSSCTSPLEGHMMMSPLLSRFTLCPPPHQLQGQCPFLYTGLALFLSGSFCFFF